MITIRRAATGALVAGALALSVAACGSGGSSTSGSGTTSPGGSAAPGGGVGESAALVAKYEAPPTWTPPGTPLDASKLRGGTVWHVMVDASIPAFATSSAGLEHAFRQVGMDVQSCDAKFTPTGASQCVSQAVDAGAAAIITNGVPFAFVEAVQPKAAAAGIPFVVGAQTYREGGKDLTYADVNHIHELEMVAHWVIADSGGDAESLVVALSEGGGGRDPIDKGFLGVMGSCAGCENHVIETSYANLANLPPQVAASLNQYPGVDYVVPMYDGIVAGVLPGVQTAGKVDQVSGATGSGTATGLQMVADGVFLKAVAGSSNYIFAWIEADLVLRMLLDVELPRNPQPPQRLFTANNVGSLQLTSQAEMSGAWFGIDDVAGLYRTHWGLDRRR